MAVRLSFSLRRRSRGAMAATREGCEMVGVGNALASTE